MQFLFPQLTGKPLPVVLHIPISAFALFHVAGYLFIHAKLKSEPAKFVNAYMIVSSFRMLLSAVIILLFVLKYREYTKVLALFYIGAYMSMLFSEAFLLARDSKNRN